MPEETTETTAETAARASAALRALAGVEPAAVAGFISALNSASEWLGGITQHLEAARVHDEAFGKLIDAARVRDAYHERLPATEHNLAEARDVIERFLTEFAAAPAASEGERQGNGEAA